MTRAESLNTNFRHAQESRRCGDCLTFDRDAVESMMIPCATKHPAGGGGGKSTLEQITTKIACHRTGVVYRREWAGVSIVLEDSERISVVVSPIEDRANRRGSCRTAESRKVFGIWRSPLYLVQYRVDRLELSG